MTCSTIEYPAATDCVTSTTTTLAPPPSTTSSSSTLPETGLSSPVTVGDGIALILAGLAMVLVAVVTRARARMS